MVSKLESMCKRLNIRCSAEYGGVEVPKDWIPGTHPYKVVLTVSNYHTGRRQLTVPFFMGPAHTKEPTAADVLCCLVQDCNAGEMSFEEYCSELGENLDSRKAETAWRSCKGLAPRVRRFLGQYFNDIFQAEH